MQGQEQQADVKHTPGPMVVDSNTDQIPYRVYSMTTQGSVGLFYSEADAELFAAAPDLLAALREILQWADNAGCPQPFQRNAFAAIAKAEGRS